MTAKIKTGLCVLALLLALLAAYVQEVSWQSGAADPMPAVLFTVPIQ